jgi:hypothetical protein
VGRTTVISSRKEVRMAENGASAITPNLSTAGRIQQEDGQTPVGDGARGGWLWLSNKIRTTQRHRSGMRPCKIRCWIALM